MSGISNFEIVTTVVISSDIEANSKNLVESCVKTPGLFGYAKKATGRLAPIIIMVSKSLRTSTALSTTYGILTEFILPAPLSKRALNQSVLSFLLKPHHQQVLEGSLHLEVLKLLRLLF